MPDMSRVRSVVGKRWGHAHSGADVAWGGCSFGMARSCGLRHQICTSGVAFTFVLDILSKTLQHALKRMPDLSRVRPAHARFEPCEACCGQAMGARSLGAPTWLGEDVALAWRAPGVALPRP